jgi:transcriptional regulator with XRE-family HTH domain
MGEKKGISEMTIAGKIKWARKKRGWSLGALTKKTKLSLIRLSLAESDTYTIPFSELVRIAEALKRDVGWFLDGKEPNEELFLHCNRSETSGMAQ